MSLPTRWGDSLDSLYSGWSPAVASAWGKLDSSPESTGASLAAVAHLADAANVSAWLLDNFIPESVRQTLTRLLGGEGAAASAVVFAAGTHDIGKISPSFAKQAEFKFPEVIAAMQRAGLKFPLVTKHLPHSITGHIVIERWLMEQHSFPRGMTTNIACVAGGHHGFYPSPSDLTNARTSWNALGLEPTASGNLSHCPWHRARTEVLDRFASATGADQHFDRWRSAGWPLEAQMLITGLVILADWLASSDLFAYGEALPGRLTSALSHLHLPPPWRPEQPTSAEDLFRQRFPALSGASPSALQRITLEAALQVSSPALMIIEAPMGAGKTEAGFLAAEAIASRLDCGGMFVGLPTMATANPMFDRTLEWLTNTLTQEASVMLAHSKAPLNDSFAGLLRASRFSGIYDEGEGLCGAKAVVASWLTGRKKSTQASFVVGTIDQLLLMALRAKHVALRHVAMAGKVIIIDECHAADDYMRVYLKRALTWLARLGTPVILMSATLPPHQRQELVDAYSTGLGVRSAPLKPSAAYPRLTVTSLSGHAVIDAEPDGREVTVAVEPIGDDPHDLSARLADLLVNGGCAAVICNTVDRAQTTFEALETTFGSDTVLLHSRFIAQHRANRERDLVDRLGRNGDRPHRLVVVGTQVLEQSLDIDVDLMVTDLAPIDLVLQRIGRLHRHERLRRPGPVSRPKLLVRGVDFSKRVPAFPQGSVAVYGSEKLLRSAALIGENGLPVVLPVDIPFLVDRAYAPAFQPPPGWEEDWAVAETASRARLSKQVDAASQFLLTDPDEYETLVGTSDASTTDPESSKSRGKRQVRDAEETLEVIVLQRDATGALRLPAEIGLPDTRIPESPLEDIPDRTARAMAATTISLPLAMMRDFDRIEPVLNASPDYTLWDRSPWLRGQLALVLDQNGVADVADFHLAYDNRKGLIYTRGGTNA